MFDIFVPVYNEGRNIEALFDNMKKCIRSDFEVLIVYDFDEDGTLPVIERIRDRYPFPIRLEKNIYGRGALSAFKTGMAKARYDYVLFTMADLSDGLESVDAMYEKALEGYDIVCGSRYMRGGKQIGGPPLKGFFSRCAGTSLHYLIGIPTHDITNGFKIYSRRAIHTIRLESTGGFEVCMEMTVKAYLKGYPIAEVPATWCDRTEGESKFPMWKWIPKYLKWYGFAIRNKWFGSVWEKKADSKNIPIINEAEEQVH